MPAAPPALSRIKLASAANAEAHDMMMTTERYQHMQRAAQARDEEAASAEVARLVATRIHEGAGVEPKLGKFKVWSRGGGPEPPGLDALLDGAPRPAEPVWKGDLEAAQNGIVILGAPVGSPEFVQRFLGNRYAVQARFWERLKQVPDLQTAWLLLLYCANPRANHLIRAISPDLVADYARAHDDGLWATFLDLIGYPQRAADGPGRADPAEQAAAGGRVVRQEPSEDPLLHPVGQR